MKKILSAIALATGVLFAGASFADNNDDGKHHHDWQCKVENISKTTYIEVSKTPSLPFSDRDYAVIGGTFSTAPSTFYTNSISQSQNFGHVYLYSNGELVVDATLCADSNLSICRTISDTLITVNILPDGSRVMKYAGKSELYHVVLSGVLSTSINGAPAVSVLDMTGSTGYVLTVAK